MPFSPSPASASAASLFVPAILPQEARPSHEHTKSKSSSFLFLAFRALRPFFVRRRAHLYHSRRASKSETGHRRFSRSFFAGVQSFHLASLPKLSPFRRLPSPRR